MADNASAQTIIQNLKDAGCNFKMVQQFIKLGEEGQTEEQLHLLSLHRRQLLDRVHQEERRIGCLDYLVYQIKKAQTAN